MNIHDNFRRSLLAVLAAILFNMLFPLPPLPYSMSGTVLYAEAGPQS
jgi:hypothetical protein